MCCLKLHICYFLQGDKDASGLIHAIQQHAFKWRWWWGAVVDDEPQHGTEQHGGMTEKNHCHFCLSSGLTNFFIIFFPNFRLRPFVYSDGWTVEKKQRIVSFNVCSFPEKLCRYIFSHLLVGTRGEDNNEHQQKLHVQFGWRSMFGRMFWPFLSVYLATFGGRVLYCCMWRFCQHNVWLNVERIELPEFNLRCAWQH